MEITRREAQVILMIIEQGTFAGRNVIEIAQLKMKLMQWLKGEAEGTPENGAEALARVSRP